MSDKERDKLLIVDGHALIHRAFHAIPSSLTTGEGVPTGAVYGFTRLLLAALKLSAPTFVVVTFDSRGPTFRHEKFDGYKAHRQRPDDDLLVQIPLVKEVVASLSIPKYEVPGFEADDLIGTVSRQAVAEQVDVLILTGDMDMLQLVDDHTVVLAPRKGMSDPALYTPESVREKYGFGPEKVTFYKALKGDPSDNIPGVPGIGDITARKIVVATPSLDALYQELSGGQRPGGISDKIAEKILANEEVARLSLELATIDRDAPVSFDALTCRTHEYDRETAVDLFVKLGFRSLLRELPGYTVTGGETLFNPAELETARPVQPLDQEVEPSLRAIEQKGVLINQDYLAKLDLEWRQEMQAGCARIHQLAGRDFNVDSSRQLAGILYDELKLPTDEVKKGKTGYTTDAHTLHKLKDLHPIIPAVLNYRELAKLVSTYTTPLPKLVGEDGRLHTTYTTDTSTGRLSSKNPNLQNIPIRSEKGQLIRKAFVAAPGKILVRADYSQIELRVVAHLARDPQMIASFRAGKDIHAATSEAMGVDRRVAKIINFSLLYGKGAYGLSEDIGCSREEAAAFIKQYFAAFPGVEKWIEETLRFLGRHGYVETLFGLKRHFPGTKGTKPNRYSRFGREAINLPVQGTAAEILKRAMIEIHHDSRLHDTMILTVHDELVLEVPRAQVEQAGRRLKEIMEKTTTLVVPLLVEVGTGENWGDTKE